MTEADEPNMIDGFFTTVFPEHMATLRAWSQDPRAVKFGDPQKGRRR